MIFNAIRESHDLQRDLCRKLTASRGDMADRQVLFLQLKVELMAHAAAEERHLYVPLLMEDGGLDASRHALHEHHEVDELLDDLSVRNKKQAGWIATAKKLSFKVRHHLKEEESKFFQLAGRLLSATKKQQLARAYTREIVRMRKHYAAEYETVAVSAASGLVKARQARGRHARYAGQRANGRPTAGQERTAPYALAPRPRPEFAAPARGVASLDQRSRSRSRPRESNRRVRSHSRADRAPSPRSRRRCAGLPSAGRG